MTSFFPDLNVWLALSVAAHSHSQEAWNWLGLLPAGTKLIFARYTHLGLLRLLTNEAVMGRQTVTLRQAWNTYDRWLSDPRVEFHPEPRGMDAAFRKAAEPVDRRRASNWVGDCYLLAYAHENAATLATFDKRLLRLARDHGYLAVVPS